MSWNLLNLKKKPIIVDGQCNHFLLLSINLNFHSDDEHLRKCSALTSLNFNNITKLYWEARWQMEKVQVLEQ